MKRKTKVVDYEKLYGPHRGKDYFLAMNPSHTKVLATGKTPQEAYSNAVKIGNHTRCVITHAPPKNGYGIILAAA